MKTALASFTILQLFITTSLFAQAESKSKSDSLGKSSQIRFEDYTTAHLMFLTNQEFHLLYGFQTINGIQIGSSFYAGLGLGLDIFSVESDYLTGYFPVFMNISSGIQEENVRAYLSFSFGYGLCILTPGTGHYTEYRPSRDDGFMFNLSAGASIHIHNCLHYLLGVGYKRQADGTPSFGDYRMWGIETGISF